MSLFRILIILFVVVMILPIGNDETAATRDNAAPGSSVSTGEFVDAAVSAAYDVSGICSRQPVVCSIGYEIWSTFQRKSVYLAGYLYDLALNAQSPNQVPAQNQQPRHPGMQEPSSPVPGAHSDSQPPTGPRSDRIEDPSSTLTESDRALPWRGPAT